MTLADTYIQYGVPSDWAHGFASASLSVTQFRAANLKTLEEHWGVPRDRAIQVKAFLARQPIDSGTLTTLLSRNAFACCLCYGIRSSAGFIVHHIEEYSKTQNNSYANLAVLCLSCHDGAHASTESLTRRITSEQIRKGKDKWEARVEREAAARAAGQLDIDEVDYINIERIEELAEQLLDANHALLSQRPALALPLHTQAANFGVRRHYRKLFHEIMKRCTFVNLEDLLSMQRIRDPRFLGTFAFYVGGTYGNGFEWPPSAEQPTGYIHLRKRSFRVRWPIIPAYITSSTGFGRIAKRYVHVIYGRVLDVRRVDKRVEIEMRPYLVGWPRVMPDRTPLVHYVKRALSDEDEDE